MQPKSQNKAYMYISESKKFTVLEYMCPAVLSSALNIWPEMTKCQESTVTSDFS